MDASFLVIDPELENLFVKFSKHHNEGAKDVLKLLLKSYLKLADNSRKVGADPIFSMQDMVERIVSGDLYRNTKDKIKHLDQMLEQTEGKIQNLEGSPIYGEIQEIKSLLRGLNVAGPSGHASALDQFSPSDAAKLLTVDKSAQPKKGQSYKDLRGKGNKNKKIVF